MNNETFYNATGDIEYNMTNDYMFRVILQQNEIVLKGLLCSLLRLNKEEVKSIVLRNPIKLGETIDIKDFYMDVNLMLNDNSVINLEMQVVNEHNWTDRSLSYTCRSYLELSKGQDYAQTKPVIHIGFLDYTLFPEHLEFYATYKLMNVKTHQVFNEKFTIGVVNLRRIDLATEEDCAYGLDDWIRLFKARTWEELKMIAEKKPEFMEASQSIYEYNGDMQIRQQCIAREEHLHRIKKFQQASDELEKITIKTEQLKVEKRELITENKQLSTENEQLSTANEQLQKQNEQLMAELEKYKSMLTK